MFRAGLVVTSSVLNELGNGLVVDLRSVPPEDVASHLPCIMEILLQFATEGPTAEFQNSRTEFQEDAVTAYVFTADLAGG